MAISQKTVVSLFIKYYCGMLVPNGSVGWLITSKHVGSSPIFRIYYSSIEEENLNRKKVLFIKYITKDGIKKLLSKGIIKNTHRGYVSKNGSEVGYYMTSGKKRYIQDKYADIAEKL